MSLIRKDFHHLAYLESVMAEASGFHKPVVIAEFGCAAEGTKFGKNIWRRGKRSGGKVERVALRPVVPSTLPERRPSASGGSRQSNRKRSSSPDRDERS